MALALPPLGLYIRALLMILGIDPGKDKIGWAFADSKGALLFSGIVNKEELSSFWEVFMQKQWHNLLPWLKEREKEPLLSESELTIVVGNGTTCKEVLLFLKERGLDAQVVEEYGTTLEARKVYWRLHPPQGVWKFIPKSLRVPNRDVDDLAAFVIIRRYLASKTRGQVKE